jgi:hypothetical protein
MRRGGTASMILNDRSTDRESLVSKTPPKCRLLQPAQSHTDQSSADRTAQHADYASNLNQAVYRQKRAGTSGDVRNRTLQ